MEPQKLGRHTNNRGFMSATKQKRKIIVGRGGGGPIRYAGVGKFAPGEKKALFRPRNYRVRKGRDLKRNEPKSFLANLLT